MSSRSDQNGCQPPLPAMHCPSSEAQPKTENATSNDQPKQICRNYVWGTCTKHATCKFRHELIFEEMKKILKFCHDYQNRTGCAREDCTYLHATREEENLFLANGQLPRVLAERHAAMSASTNVETIPQIAMFIRDSYVPPPSTLTTTAPSAAPAPTAQPQPPALRSAHTAPPSVPTLPMMPIQQPPLPPPPPPPPPPPTVAATVACTAPVYTAPPPPPPQTTPVGFPINQPPPPLPVMFDASRPPPPLPTKSGAVKHKSPSICEVGPSKIRKTEDTNVADAHCEHCVQLKIRIDFYAHEIDNDKCEKEYKALVLKKNQEELETIKDLMRCSMNADFYNILERHIENVPQIQLQDILSQLNQTSFSSGVSTVPKQFLLQLKDCDFSNSRTLDSWSTHNLDETLLQSLSSLIRRTNSSINHSSSLDVIQAFVGLLQSSNINIDKTQSNDLNNEINRIGNTDGNNMGVNVFNGFNVGTTSQKVEGSSSVSTASTVPYSSANIPTRSYIGVSTVASSTSGSQINATPSYPSYQPSIPPPPPTRPYSNQTFTALSSNIQNISNNITNGANASVTQPTPSRSSTSTAVPVLPDSQNGNQYFIGMYPPPHYYSPY